MSELINEILILDRKFLRIKDNRELIAIVPNPKLGYYKTLVWLKDNGYNINQLCDLDLMLLNPQLFKPIN